MKRRTLLKKFRIAGLLFAILGICSLAAFAAVNAKQKPMDELGVPGNWTISHADATRMWFTPMTAYSSKVYEHFAGPAAPADSEFGDHPDFTAAMRAGEADPTATVSILANDQMNAYLETLPKDNMTIRYIGDYPRGIRMPLLVFSKPRLADPSGENLRALGKPIYYLRAQIHGNEIAATAGAILLAQRLARGHADLAGVLDKISIVILPRFNGDGTKLQQRGTTLVSGDSWGTGKPDFLASEGSGGGASEYAFTGLKVFDGLDQNRDNLWLGAPASRANARILAEYKPEFCLDAHEYGCSSTVGLPVKSADAGGFYYATSQDADGNARIRLRDAGGTQIYYKEQMTTQWANHLLVPDKIRNYAETIQQNIWAGMGQSTNPGGSYLCVPYVEGSYGLLVNAGDKGLGRTGLVSLDTVPAGSQRNNMAQWADLTGSIPPLKPIAYNTSTEGGFDPGTARNTMALTPAISFLTESRSAGGRWEYQRRVMGQYLTSLYYIKAILSDLDTYVNAVRQARADVIASGQAENIGKTGNTIPVTQTYAEATYDDVVSYGVYHEDGLAEDIPGYRRNSRFGTTPVDVRKRPYSYIIDGDYDMANDIVFRMSHLGIAFERTTEPVTVEVEVYTVTSADASPGFGQTSRVRSVSVATKSVTLPTGSYVCYMEQQMANFAAVTFEPMSMRAWIGKDLANVGVILNKEAPFYRYMKTEKIAPVEKIEITPLDFTDAFLYRDVAMSVADSQAALKAAGLAQGYAQTATIYGDIASAGSVKAYLPSDGTRRSWYVLDRSANKYVRKATAFDSGMNRSYIAIDAASLRDDGDGYYTFDMIATAASGSSGGSGGSCDTGAGALLALAGAAMCARRKRF